MLESVPFWFWVFFTSMIPWWESRYAIVVAIDMGWEWWQAFPLAVAGNMLPIPFVLLFFGVVENFLRRFAFWNDFLDRLFSHTRSRADAKIRRYEHLGLLLFVAIPVPFTGAWTGSLIAYIFGLNFWKSLLTIFVGVLCAAGIMTVITLLGVDIFYIFIGVIIAGVIMSLLFIMGIRNSKKTRD